MSEQSVSEEERAWVKAWSPYLNADIKAAIIELCARDEERLPRQDDPR